MSKFLNRVGFVVFVNLLFSAFVAAAPVDLRKSTPDEILKVSAELDPHFRTIQRSLKTPEKRSVGEDIAAIRGLSKYFLSESAYTIFSRYRMDVASPVGMRSPELRELALDSLLNMMTEEDNHLFMEIVGLEEMLRKLAKDRPEHAEYTIAVADELLQFRKRIEAKPAAEALPTFDELRAGPLKDRELALRSLDTFKEILEKKVKGQEEVVEALITMEWESRFFADSEKKPDTIYLMGSPGTGKDTVAKAFADALNSHEGAYKKHMYRLPIMRSQADLWQVLGSATGYVGSGQFPPFLNFLVEHSGGKYILEKTSAGTAIKLNPDWKGEPLLGYARPDQAVVFVNEFHNWSKEIKDVLIKEALENGIFNVNNPNGGLNQIEVPVRFVIASNEGLGLVTSREANGARYGKALSIEEMLKKWDRVHNNKRRLKAEIMNGNGAARDPSAGNRVNGVSEELLNRVDDRFLMLMKPQRPETLQLIAEEALQEVAKKIRKASVLNPGVNLQWDQDLAEYIQTYDYDPEANARPIADKVKALVTEPLIRFLRENKAGSPLPLDLRIRIQGQDDGTSSLEIDAYETDGQYLGRFLEPITYTNKDLHKDSISDDQIERLTNLGSKIKARVFGVDAIADRIAERVVSLANQANQTSNKGARAASTIVLMGLSSTGKTELSKAVSEALTGDEKDALVIDFSQVQSIQDFKARLLGLRDAYGNPIPSDFMMHYDRMDGDIVVVLDELSNVRDPEMLKSLYDFFREPVLSTFSDGKERIMSQVKIIVTGNSGIEEFKNVPRHVPMEQQMMAWEEIAKGLQNDVEYQRRVLERSFPEPLINRWGMNNIFFVPPHTYASLKQVALLKMRNAIEALKPEPAKRGWNIGFESEEELTTFVHMLVEKAFNLREQGASIDNFVRDDFKAILEAKLLISLTRPGSNVLLKRNGAVFEIINENGTKVGAFDMRGKAELKPNKVAVNKIAKVLTAYHEVGHAVTQKVLMEGISEPDKISIVEGVTRIGDEWVAYNGVATHKYVGQSRGTYEWIVRQIAILAAGETAERLVTKDGVHSSGKSNDMMRATGIAQEAILVYGLSEIWGTESVPSGTNINAYIAGFSEQKKKLFESEVTRLLQEGRQMAEVILQQNFEEVVIPLAKELAAKGHMDAAGMAPHFEKLKDFDDSWTPAKKSWITKFKEFLNSDLKVKELVAGRSQRRDGVLKEERLHPETVAVIEDIVKERKKKQFDSVKVSQTFEYFRAADFASKEVEDCETLLK